MSATAEPTGLAALVTGGPVWWARQSFASGMRRRGMYDRRYDRYERNYMPGGRASWAFLGRMMAFGAVAVLLPCAVIGGLLSLAGQSFAPTLSAWLGLAVALWGIVTVALPWLGWLLAPNAGPTRTSHSLARRLSLAALLVAAVVAAVLVFGLGV